MIHMSFSSILLKMNFYASPLPESETRIIKELFRHFCRHLWRLLHDGGSDCEIGPIGSFLRLIALI